MKYKVDWTEQHSKIVEAKTADEAINLATSTENIDNPRTLDYIDKVYTQRLQSLAKP